MCRAELGAPARGDRLAGEGGRGRRETIASAVEHDAVLRIEEGRARLPVDHDGCVETGNGTPLAAALDPREAAEFFAIQHVNSETGVIQPIAAVNALRREPWVGRDTWLLCDCSQSVNRLTLPDADLIAVSAHKLGGPPGIGALLVRDLALLRSTGGQERGYRPGTENLPGALGFAAALEAPRDWVAALAPLRAALDAEIVAAGGEIVAAAAPRIATIASYRMPGRTAQAQLIRFDLAGFAVSAGSACSSGSMRPSHVLAAMGWPEEAASEVIRVSFGWTTTADDVARFAAAWRALAGEARAKAA